MTKATTKVTSMGICRFCKGEFDRTKMSQHLKYCKQRATEIAAEGENATASQKARLFHIAVEGRYNPQYWMHLEMPASDTLADLDSFLRDIWLECCGHLSAFQVGHINYSVDRGDFYYSEDDEDEEDVDEEEQEDIVEEPENLLATLPPILLEEIPPDLLVQLNKFESLEDLLSFLDKEAKSLMSFDIAKNLSAEEREALYNRYRLGMNLRTLVRALQNQDIYVPLEKALKVGQKFTHEYDFGSTTHLALRVVAGREGVVQKNGDEKDNIVILARNVPPVISCCVCGKPAKRIASGYYYIEENAYCSSKCAKKKGEYYEEMLPVVNSPRVGVCGYTGRD